VHFSCAGHSLLGHTKSGAAEGLYNSLDCQTIVHILTVFFSALIKYGMNLVPLVGFKISFGIAILLCSSSGVVAQAGEDRVPQIAAALREGQYEPALQMLRSALRQYPLNAELWTMEGVAYNGLGSEEEALGAFRHALKISPDAIPALQGAAKIEYDKGSVAGVPILEHLLRLRPNDLTSHGMLAVLEYQQGNCGAAVPHFEKAAPLFESRLPALHAYGTCLVKLKQLDAAADVFKKSLALNSEDPRERQVLASVQLMSSHSEQAIETLTPLLSATPDAATLELASAAYEVAHDTEKAVESLRQAILQDPQNVRLYVDFAALSATHQSFQVGINAVNEGIALQPKAAQLYFARGVLYVQLAEYEKAQADFDKAYELDPSQSLSAAAQGLAAVQQNDLTNALAGVEEKLVRKPDDPLLLYLRADILAEQGPDPGSAKSKEALRSAQQAVKLRPALEPARSVLAKLYLQNGQYPEAAEQCRKALEIDPKDQTALYHLIQALRKTDRRGDIPKLLKQLASLRQQATHDEREQYRYKLVEGDVGSK
jgi:tetratricopeptide (TPR) repeat protein